MKNNHYLTCLNYCLYKLYTDEIIAYPTESVFGLGCNPDSKRAIYKLLNIKKRDISKGFILVASNYDQLKPYIEESKISLFIKQRMLFYWSLYNITFLLPAKSTVPFWITGDSSYVAVRISNHISIINLCNYFGKPIISTSANISGKKSCTSEVELIKQFNLNIPLLPGKLGFNNKNSRILNLINGELIRD
ncbi:Sua5/YciO/YrdC/YwlC family protein [Buchnera aphidicola (Neophyllaphis podocarpi)]|uniref:Sua5/YciO/YrdC/YwlC family protein n=1 Tax=Buchnera aphidicola TaxID=9 RepID=UPI0031B80542